MRDTSDREATVGVRPLRLVVTFNSPTDHFCPRCDCMEVRLGGSANPCGDWCADPECRCHDEDLG